MNPFRWIYTKLTAIQTAAKELNTEIPDKRIEAIQSTVDLIKYRLQREEGVYNEFVKLKSQVLLLEAEISLLYRENKELWEMKEIIQEAVK